MINQEIFKVFAGDNQSAIDNSIMDLKTNRIIERIWEKDFTVWSDKPTEIIKSAWLVNKSRYLVKNAG